MATYTTNSRGQRQYRPGTSVTVTTSALQSGGDAERGIIGVMYEASRGGQPKVPWSATSAGDLTANLPANLAWIWSKLLFSPGKPGTSPRRTLGGAGSVVFCRVNPATQSTITLNDVGAVGALIINASDWGLYGNDIQVKVETGVDDVTAKLFTAKYAGVEYEIEGGNLPIVSLLYDDTFVAKPAGWAVTAVEATIAPNAADGDVATSVSYAFTAPTDIARDPSTWMAFDGPVTVAIGAQTAGAARDVIFTGVLKEDYLTESAGDTVTETLNVLSADSATTARSWSEITSIDTDDALEGDATFTGYAFALTKYTASAVATYNTATSVIDRINQKTARGFAATALSARSTFLVEDMDSASAVDITTVAEFDANLFDLMEKINQNIGIVEATMASTGVDVPANIAYTNLVGGSDGATGTTDWTEALAAMETETVNEIVPWTTSAVYNALVLEHCETMTLEGKGERTCSIAVPLATSKGTAAGTLGALSLAVNSRLASIHCQGLKAYNESSVLTSYDPCATAMLTAALQAGRSPDYGITWALANNVIELVEKPPVSGSAFGATNWTAQHDLEWLIEHGYTVLEKTKTGFRVARGNTSYLGTDPQYSSRLAVETTLLATTTLRENTEAAVGQSTTVPESILQGAIEAILNQMVDSNIIVAWDESSLVLTPSGEKTLVSVNVTVAVERLWIQITLNTTV